MTSTLVDEYPSLFHELIFFPLDVSVIVITYLTLIKLIFASFFGIFDRIFPGWDPGPDPHKPSLRRILCRRPMHSPKDHCWNCCQKCYNFQWARRRIYSFQLSYFQQQPPDIVQKNHCPEFTMPLLLFSFFASPLKWNDSVTSGHNSFQRYPPCQSFTSMASLSGVDVTHQCSTLL